MSIFSLINHESFNNKGVIYLCLICLINEQTLLRSNLFTRVWVRLQPCRHPDPRTPLIVLYIGFWVRSVTLSLCLEISNKTWSRKLKQNPIYHIYTISGLKKSNNTFKSWSHKLCHINIISDPRNSIFFLILGIYWAFKFNYLTYSQI